MRPDEPEPLQLSDAECVGFFRRLFPGGFAGVDVLAVLAPGGWARSPLVRAFHPTLDQWHAERVANHRHAEKLKKTFRRRSTREHDAGCQNETASKPEPAMEDSRRDFHETTVDVLAECTHVVGAACWEIFSDNHTVVAADGREIALGSWRASSAFLDTFAAGAANADSWHDGDDMRFYMGYLWIRDRCDYDPVYQMIFRRLRHEGGAWIYSFPQLHVVRFDRDDDGGGPSDYDPSAAFAREQERAQAEAERARADADLAQIDAEARHAARLRPPPPVVEAYRAVFGRWPEGWPP